MYTNEARKIAAVPFWFRLHAPLSEIVSFICTQSSLLRHRTSQTSPTHVSFWKSKISDVKNYFFRFCTMFDAVVPLLEASSSITFSAVREYPVKK